MDRLRAYVRESFEELRTKMTWPTWQNLQQTTGIVLLACAVLALVIFFMDSIANQVLSNFIYRVK
jgi:preprotein translocase subunit SecE